MDDLQRRALAAQLAGPAFYAEILRDQHRPTSYGLCAGCTAPGYGVPHLPWPCVLWRLADDAVALHHTRKIVAPMAA